MRLVKEMRTRAKGECDGKGLPFFRLRRLHIYPTDGIGSDSTSLRFLCWLNKGEYSFQCGNGRWHKYLDDDNIPDCAWGLMPYYDAPVAHEAARRLASRVVRWRDPSVIFASAFVVAVEAARLVIGDAGLLRLLGITG